MRVLLLNTYAESGGAAVAAQRMLRGLLDAGVDARLLVAAPLAGDSDRIESVYGLHQRVAFWRERIEIYYANGFDRSHLFRYSSASTGVDISTHPWVEWAEVIHLHWVQQGFLSLSGLEKLFALPGKRLFWTLHDLWPITGGCHIPYYIEEGYTYFCHQYRELCHVCPILNNRRARLNLAQRVHERKQRWPYDRLHFLGVSKAVTDEIKQCLLRYPTSLPPHTISNIINTDTFYPEKDRARSSRFKLLFVAARLDDPVKGIDLLRELLEKAASRSEPFRKEAELLIVGKVRGTLPPFPIDVVAHKTADIEQLRDWYNSAHMTLSTSRYETFGQTILESIACGTPAMAFEAGGANDIIQSGINGELIQPYDTEEYAEKLLHYFAQPGEPDRDRLVSSVTQFHSSQVIRSLIALYTAL